MVKQFFLKIVDSDSDRCNSNSSNKGIFLSLIHIKLK